MIRPYSTKDQKKVLNLFRLNVPKYFAPEEEQELEEYLNTDSENYFVLEQDEKILGAGGLNWFDEKQYAKIAWDFIHPDHQGKGLGQQLTKFRINKIRTSSPKAKIIVRTSQHAFKFYQKQGFKVEKIEKDYWAKGFDLYYMVYQ